MEENTIEMNETIEDNSIEILNDEELASYEESEGHSMAPGIALGLAIGAAGAVVIPKAIKGAKKGFGVIKEKVTTAVENHKQKKAEKESEVEDDHFTIEDSKEEK